MIKRLFTLCAFFVLFVVVMVFPVSADDLSGDSYVDLLPADKYSQYTNGSFVEHQNKPFEFVSGATDHGYMWAASIYDRNYSVIYVTITSAVKPSNLYISLYSGFTPRAMSLVGSSGSSYQYVWTNNYGYNIGNLYIYGTWSSSYSGNFGLTSVFGLKDTADPIELASYRFRYRTFNASGYQYTNYSSGSGYLPLGDTYSMYDPTESLFSGELFIWFNENVRAYEFCDSVTFLVSSFCPLMDYSISLLDSGFTPVHVLDCTLSEGPSSSTTPGNFEKAIFFYQITADLTGIDLNDLIVQLHCSVESTYYGSSTDYQAVQIMCYSVSMVPTLSEIPWYQIQYNWLNNSITANSDRIIDALSSLTFNDPEADFDAEEVVNQATQDKLKAEAIKDKLNSAAKPSVSDVKTVTDISDFQSSNGKYYVGNVMSGLINDKLTLPFIILVFSFALTAFIFFGKR